MSTTAASGQSGTGLLGRTLREGYGAGAWHGPDLREAITDVAAGDAFRRPAAGRHNIAEIVLHHAYYVHDVRRRLTGSAPEPFVHDEGEWVKLADDSRFSWPQITAALDQEQRRLSEVVAGLDAGRPSDAGDRYDLVLGITCHAIYHAGQVQLIKKLIA
jgi:hypothetical protein